jgi:hypothetical protein
MVSLPFVILFVILGPQRVEHVDAALNFQQQLNLGVDPFAFCQSRNGLVSRLYQLSVRLLQVAKSPSLSPATRAAQKRKPRKGDAGLSRLACTTECPVPDGMSPWMMRDQMNADAP